MEHHHTHTAPPALDENGLLPRHLVERVLDYEADGCEVALAMFTEEEDPIPLIRRMKAEGKRVLWVGIDGGQGAEGETIASQLAAEGFLAHEASGIGFAKRAGTPSPPRLEAYRRKREFLRREGIDNKNPHTWTEDQWAALEAIDREEGVTDPLPPSRDDEAPKREVSIPLAPEEEKVVREYLEPNPPPLDRRGLLPREEIIEATEAESLSCIQAQVFFAPEEIDS